MQRFFLSPSAFEVGRVVFPEDTARQIYQVLRLRPGETVVVLDNSGWEYECVLRLVTQKTASAEILQKRRNEREPTLQLTLYQCLLKSDHFEWVLQKGTELGISRFVPVTSERTVVTSPRVVKQSKLERWRRVIIEAAEQSGRGRLPVLEEVLSLQDAFKGTNHPMLSVIPWEEQADPGLRSLLREESERNQPIETINLFIGPEGGFSKEEIQSAEGCGVIPVTLGKRILRAETAAIVAAALVLSHAGELD